MRGGKVTVSLGRGGWWAMLDAAEGGWCMHRGPYWFKWMASMAFPIERWIYKIPHR